MHRAYYTFSTQEGQTDFVVYFNLPVVTKILLVSMAVR